MTYSFVANSANDQMVEDTQLVLTYELSKVCDCLFDPSTLDEKKFYGQTEIADTISMVRMLCEQKRWNFEDMLGAEPTFSVNRQEVLNELFVRLGVLIRGIFYYKRFMNYRGPKPQDTMVMFISSLRKLCHCMHWDFEDLTKMGEERYKERMQDLKEKGVNEGLRKEYQRAAN